jgi:hypothetical protein
MEKRVNIIETKKHNLLMIGEKLSEMSDNVSAIWGKYVYSARYNDILKFGEEENSYLDECFTIIGQHDKEIEGVPMFVYNSTTKSPYSAIINLENNLPDIELGIIFVKKFNYCH